MMPYKSEAQRRWAHTPSGMKALGKSKVKEFDRASKGLKLPERAGSSAKQMAEWAAAALKKAGRKKR